MTSSEQLCLWNSQLLLLFSFLCRCSGPCRRLGKPNCHVRALQYDQLRKTSFVIISSVKRFEAHFWQNAMASICSTNCCNYTPQRILGISANVPCHTNRKLTRRPALPAKHTRTRLIRTSTHIMLELAPAVVLSASSQAQPHAVHYEDCPSRVTSWTAAELTVAARASRLIDSSVIARQASP